MGPMPDAVRMEELYSAAEVQRRIEELAAELSGDFAGLRLKLLVIAEGALRFAGALAEVLEARGQTVATLVVRARRTRGTKLLGVEVDPIDPREIEGQNLLVVDDIADEGRTLAEVMRLVQSAKPLSVHVAVLVSKAERRRVEVPLDYVGFEVEQGWVVGFGMDLEGRYRELDHLALVLDRG